MSLLFCSVVAPVQAESVEQGTLTIKIVRDEKRYVPARVRLEDEVLGWAPLTLDLEPGVHNFTLEDPTGHRKTREVRIRVTKGLHTERFFKLPINEEGRLYREAARKPSLRKDYQRVMKRRRRKRQQNHVQYVVGGLSTLADVAEAFRMTEEELSVVNPGVDGTLRPGTRIWLPEKAARRRPKTRIRGRVISAPTAQVYSPLRGMHEAAEACASQGPVEILERDHRLFYRRVRGKDTVDVLAAQFGDDPGAIRRRNKIERKRVPRGWGILIKAVAERVSASARGSNTKGRLLNGEQMPPGLGHVVRYPMHAFGTSRMVDLLYSVFEDLRRCDPDMPPIVVGDLSKPKGGAFPPHKSHQNGRDVDLSYVPALQMHVARGFMADRTTMDVPRTWAFLKRLMDTGQVEFLFVDHSVQKLLYDYVKSTMTPEELRRIFQYPTKAQRGIMRHSSGHIDHVHVRFKKPSRLTNTDY